MYTLKDLVIIAKNKSPFYKDLYRNINPESFRLEDLPLIDLERWVEANTIKNNQILTEKLTEAVVIKTGGSTGKSKLSYYKNSELREISEFFTSKNIENGMKDGDRVATMVPAGNLYGSYLFTAIAFHYSPLKQVVYHFGFNTPFEELASFMNELNINTIVSFPTYIRQFANYLKENNIENLAFVERIYYFGETMFHDIRDEVKSVFKNCTIHSSGYSSVDGALIGYVDIGCGYNEHRSPDGMTIVELLDEFTEKPISETGKSGRIYITNLAKGLMPIIRYPSGDMGQWVEPENSPNRKFMLLGRSSEGVRLFGPIFYFNDVANLLFPFCEEYGLLNFQMIASRSTKKECLTLRIALKNDNIDKKTLEEKIKNAFNKKYPISAQNIIDGIMAPLKLDFCKLNDLEISSVSGKTLRVIDARF